MLVSQIKEHGHEPSFDEFYDYNHQKTGGDYVDGRSKDARVSITYVHVMQPPSFNHFFNKVYVDL